ncbi:MAG: AGE family epimerase/isomerase [Victivallales bacterium]|nr:AGE family epimerase/isomerase [Victivallales bacterium]
MKLEQLLRTSMETMLERFSRHNCGNFIDTKFNVDTGEDFAQEDSFRGKSHIYGWIQARGLESLAKHAKWFEEHGDKAFAKKLDKMLDKVMHAVLDAVVANGGTLPFVMAPDATPYHKLSSYHGYGDIFYCKGLFCAARRLHDKKTTDIACDGFCDVTEALKKGHFRTDQQSFDPKNPVEYVPGKKLHGPKMIALDGLADLLDDMPDNEYWLDTSVLFFKQILQRHVLRSAIRSKAERFEFVEAVNKNGSPWKEENGVVLSDPGHALEFLGHTARVLKVIRKHKIWLDIETVEPLFGTLLMILYRSVFKYGYNPKAHGIVKTYDLTNRKYANSDMPWWSLPEAARAAHLLAELYPKESKKARLVNFERTAISDFQNYYLRPSGFAVQTRDAEGKVVNVIPAVPDADPGYHTNLSLMECGEL